ncbi:MAG TPA: O-methyltransferase [Tissierellaceae bacterium]|nr:O-methyltransferase [Tissierellaceae bacterium]
MSNINEKYIEKYIREVIPEKPIYLREMEDYAKKHHIPIIEPEVAQFLKVILKVKKPRKILEIGTAIGYSALVMANALSGTCQITTIERREDMIALADQYIKKTPYTDNIKIIKGQAEEILPRLKKKYDLIFIDAAKGQYMEFFNECTKCLNPEGLIISDNVLFRGMVASDDLVVRRKKTIVKRLRQYLEYINEIPGYTSSLIPIGDGVALTYREA